MIRRLILILGVVFAASAAAAEPSNLPAPDTLPFKSLFPIAGAAGGLVAPRSR